MNVIPPEAETLMAVLDHLDAAYDLAKSVNAQVCEHIHLAREEAKRQAGWRIFDATRRARIDGSQLPGGDGPSNKLGGAE